MKIVHPKNGEEAWWPLFDEAGVPLFPELMVELDAIKETMVSGLVFRRDHEHRRSRTRSHGSRNARICVTSGVS